MSGVRSLGQAGHRLSKEIDVKVKLGPLQVLGTGKIAGVISTKRGNVPVVRRRYPPQVATPAQLVVRGNWARVDRSWQDLDAEDVAAWNAYRRWQRKLGYNQYMRVNVPRGLTGEVL